MILAGGSHFGFGAGTKLGLQINTNYINENLQPGEHKTHRKKRKKEKKTL